MSYEDDFETMKLVKEEMHKMVLFLINHRDETDNELVKATIGRVLDGEHIMIKVECESTGEECHVSPRSMYGLIDSYEVIHDHVQELELEVAFGKESHTKADETEGV